MVKNQQKQFLYKYTSLDTAKKIFKNKALRWGSPSYFNDPFDTQIKLIFDISMSDYKVALLEEINKIYTNDHLDSYNESKLIESLRYLKSKNISFNIIKNTILKGVGNFNQVIEIAQKKFTDLVNTYKILCLSEINDDLLMWAHYSDSHKGVVLRLNCKSEPDTVFLNAKPIQYSNKMPIYANLSTWIKHITGQVRLDNNKYFNDVIYTKSIDWQYEKEWRVVNSFRDPTKPHEDFEILTSEIDGIIFGCKTKRFERDEVLDIAKSNDFNFKEILLAKQSKTEFKLDFEKIY